MDRLTAFLCRLSKVNWQAVQKAERGFARVRAVVGETTTARLREAVAEGIMPGDYDAIVFLIDALVENERLSVRRLPHYHAVLAARRLAGRANISIPLRNPDRKPMLASEIEAALAPYQKVVRAQWALAVARGEARTLPPEVKALVTDLFRGVATPHDFDVPVVWQSESGRLVVYRASERHQAYAIGMRSKWCTAVRRDSAAESFLKSGDLFAVWADAQPVVQLHAPTRQIESARRASYRDYFHDLSRTLAPREFNSLTDALLDALVADAAKRQAPPCLADLVHWARPRHVEALLDYWAQDNRVIGSKAEAFVYTTSASDVVRLLGRKTLSLNSNRNYAAVRNALAHETSESGQKVADADFLLWDKLTADWHRAARYRDALVELVQLPGLLRQLVAKGHAHHLTRFFIDVGIDAADSESARQAPCEILLRAACTGLGIDDSADLAPGLAARCIIERMTRTDRPGKASPAREKPHP